ncbi:tRNA (adenosine(37)-N6)-threonylcarbamoyltransferase complex dimerization subunit type 1 TsaB [Lacticaseibacillus manihotivorans]|jgi:tRNA threonylcarbamoyl adenosine modification protein YeaZ|uniref:M22 family O-sialoglycoprotein endopeptidase n=2 Tax=Lacticaseibacillus manihotivorans TaxID=88233 RepID=A0A0R1Q4N8_9LACO|nr:tRNA (adenosine(37)-N6)-threonylcarbamoyltransferase complex dimerization subunit type 1 TsaB [Lacticaseibacillus manihotivorans]KRL39590.1 M22 family O-sialoglycoprotein endopeptidase [Lacticaseibacillus manihotivorans DSM 13343 = JCM 12514]QFQ90457.1 tRNA (adenosine(37)-N6)-threonylcarbamoyltransferase complex dimerization subunit type 1 TsaB [Lacticaseibacillus manihotivorans]
MYLLALDTSNQTMSVAVMHDQTLLAETTINHKKTHSEQLLPTIQNLLKQSDLTIDQIDRIVVAEGPGSYTGIRIAVTTGKTLAYTLNKELVGVSSLAALAAGVTDTQALIVPLMDARRQNVFAGVYQWVNGELINVVQDSHLPLTQLLEEVRVLRQPAVFVGADVEKFADEIRSTLGAKANLADPLRAYPRASRIALLGMHAKPVSVFDFVPTYLRVTEAERNWLKTHSDEGHEPYVEKV